jgi:FG-GAP-like repeat/Abnormal spindle-like microcephaly-assoc'd, ASPM-SPD-2-Hydin
MRCGRFVCLFFVVFGSVMLLAQSNPVPLINQPLVPASTVPGGQGFVLTVNGTGFVSGSAVNWNGTPRTTSYVSASQLTATIPTSDTATNGTASVTVTSPSPGGGMSNTVYFEVTFATAAVQMNKSDYGVGSEPFVVSAADVNADGRFDLVVTNQSDNNFSVLLGNGDGTFQTGLTFATCDRPKWFSVGDFNGDGKLDVAVACAASHAVSILLGNGDGTFRPHVDYSTGGEAFSIATGDFNGDGKLDLAVANYDSQGTFAILLGNGDGTFQPEVSYSTDSLPIALTTGDFNQDGKLDLAIVNQPTEGSSGVVIVLGNGDGSFQRSLSYTITAPFWVTTADFNADGRLDLVVAAQADPSLLILLGNGDGTFQNPATITSDVSALGLIAGDFNGDGKLDLATVDQGSSAYILLGIGDGSFQSPLVFQTGSGPLTVTAADFNRDGRLDLATANIYAGTVSVLLQTLAPTVSLSPPSLNFGNQGVGTTSSPQVTTLTNTGAGVLTITSIGITGTNRRDFAQTNNCPGSVPPNGSCQFSVTFSPTATGTRNATVSVSDNAPGSPQSVPLTGVGTPGVVSFSPTSLTFPDQVVFTTSPAQQVTLTNTGAGVLKINHISVPGPFSQTNNCPSSLIPNGDCTVSVRFHPGNKGVFHGAISVTDNAPGSPQKVPLTGTGTFVQLLPAKLNFGNQPVGTRSLAKKITLTNKGSSAVKITSIAITGTDAGDFAETNTCGTNVASGASCFIKVTFKPLVKGKRTADVSVYDNGGGSPQRAKLIGAGT